jgi:hypothetical protein
MKLFNLFSTALLVLCELSSTSAKAISHVPRYLSEYGVEAMLDREARDIMRRMERRQDSAGQLTPVGGNMNETISSACVGTLSQITTITNDAGMAACYNILQADKNTGIFQADIRLYQIQPPSGQFIGVASNQMLANLVFPSSTTFNVLMKRKLGKRQSSSMSELQQYSLQGNIAASMDMSKLNSTEMLSLMVPTIQIEAIKPSTSTSINTNLTSTDTAFFVVGDFKDQFMTALIDPTFQAAAIAASSAFILPGTTLGIFPTGLIVTCAWLLLFIIAYGVGTLERIQHRSIYRKRKAAISGRTGHKI